MPSERLRKLLRVRPKSISTIYLVGPDEVLVGAVPLVFSGVGGPVAPSSPRFAPETCDLLPGR